MKKTFISVCLIMILSATGLFAKSDLQLGLNLSEFEFSGSSLDLRNASLISININNHNYFWKDNTIGFSEYISYSPITSDLFNTFQGFNVSAFIGPSFRIPASEKTEFLLSGGFKYFLNYTSNTEPYYIGKVTEDPDLEVFGQKFFSAYALSFDLQVKFTADKKCSFVMGIPASAGVGKEYYKESVNTKKVSGHYRTLSSTGSIEPYVELGLPYFMFSINF